MPNGTPVFKGIKMDSKGQAIVEYIIIFPMFIMIFSCALQLFLLLIGKATVKYATFCAARTAIVSDDIRDIEQSVMSVLSTLENPHTLKLNIDVRIKKVNSKNGIRDYVIAMINYRFPLIVPVANRLILTLSNLSGIQTDNMRKRITLSESYTMSYTEVIKK